MNAGRTRCASALPNTPGSPATSESNSSIPVGPSGSTNASDTRPDAGRSCQPRVEHEDRQQRHEEARHRRARDERQAQHAGRPAARRQREREPDPHERRQQRRRERELERRRRERAQVVGDRVARAQRGLQVPARGAPQVVGEALRQRLVVAELVRLRRDRRGRRARADHRPRRVRRDDRLQREHDHREPEEDRDERDEPPADQVEHRPPTCSGPLQRRVRDRPRILEDVLDALQVLVHDEDVLHVAEEEHRVGVDHPLAGVLVELRRLPPAGASIASSSAASTCLSL